MKKDETKQKRPFAPGIQWQLMLFIGGITLFTLLLVWGIITYALEPQYNRNIRAKLDSKAAAITALIDQSDAEISSRTYQGLYLNDEFWSGVSQTFRDKKINVDGNCVDFSDSTLRCLKAYESMYPCLLHESTGAFGGEFGYNLDTRIAIQLRQKLFQDGSLYQIVKIGSSMQMCVGRLSADGQYGVICLGKSGADHDGCRGAARDPWACRVDSAGAGPAAGDTFQPLVHEPDPQAVQRRAGDRLRQLRCADQG